MRLPREAEELKEYFGGLIDDTTAEMLEEYIRGGEPVTKLCEIANRRGKVLVEGVVERVFPARSFMRNGREGRVGSVLLHDECTVRVVFWNDAAGLLDTGDIVEGAKLVVRGYARKGEIHVNDPLDVEVKFEFTKIRDLKPGWANVRGKVSGIGDPGKANEIFISDDTGRIRVVLESHSEIYFKVDIGDRIEILNGLIERRVDGMEIHLKRNSRVRTGE